MPADFTSTCILVDKILCAWSCREDTGELGKAIGWTDMDSDFFRRLLRDIGQCPFLDRKPVARINAQRPILS